MTNLEKSLTMLEEIVVTAESVEFYRKHNIINGIYINKELDRLKEQVKEWREWVKKD
ncbi:MAG: hypothetical protein Q7R95_11380 [bacterium]|nr:hypothetical protein [bacterium]